MLFEAAVELGQFLQGERMTFDLPTAMHGSAFEERVWALLRELPFGETTTYGDLAESLGDRNLARKVGQAVGRNPLSIVVGCHRVVGKGGELRGYAGGLDREAVPARSRGRPAAGRCATIAALELRLSAAGRIGDDELRVFGMAPDERLDERADRDDVKPSGGGRRRALP